MVFMNKFKIGISKKVWHEGIEVYIRKYVKHEYQDKFISKYFDGEKWKDLKEMECVNPSFLLDINESQYLMDCLYDCGIRPTEGNGSAGAMRATEKHLEDMRTLVFKKENVNGNP